MLSTHFVDGKQVIARRHYLFLHEKQFCLIDVAVIGPKGNWAAYRGAGEGSEVTIEDDVLEVVRHGNKFVKEEAEIIFKKYLPDSATWYRE